MGVRGSFHVRRFGGVVLMTPTEWDNHERKFCNSCEFSGTKRKPCPARTVMRQHPDDEQTRRLFERLGRCSQYQYSPKAEKRNAKKKR